MASANASRRTSFARDVIGAFYLSLCGSSKREDLRNLPFAADDALDHEPGSPAECISLLIIVGVSVVHARDAGLEMIQNPANCEPWNV
jgi:hypothetical protein